MKTALLFLGSIFAAFAIGFFVSKNGFDWSKKREQEIAKTEFQPASFPLENRPFVIVAVGRNNGALVEKSLKSVFSQKYDNFRIIYIDDASNDGSYELARDLIYESGQLPQVTLVRNEERLGSVANLARAVQACKDEEIVVVLGGEDRLAHEWTLQKLNQYYADPDLWAAYAQYREFPSYRLGTGRPIDGKVRESMFMGPCLKTFYAGLFKKIRESDLIYQGQYVPAAGELAYMIPILEMAEGHFEFLPDILYLSVSPNREDRELQAKVEKHIRSLAPYAPVAALLKAEREEAGSEL